MIKDNLSNRMKTYYEEISKAKLMRRTPVAVRIDGKAFHTFTRHFKKPFDQILMESMQETMKYLCENIQGCVFGYTQSDEITLILIDYQTLTTSAWFDYEVQKLCSVSASMATLAFNGIFRSNVNSLSDSLIRNLNLPEEDRKYAAALWKAVNEGAMFDARCFNIPKEEVTNLIYWRQTDAMRNSVQMVGRANFSHKQLQDKSRNDIIKMLQDKGVDWNSYDAPYRYGSACKKNENGKWQIDENMPILTEDRAYVDSLVYIGEE